MMQCRFFFLHIFWSMKHDFNLINGTNFEVIIQGLFKHGQYLWW